MKSNWIFTERTNAEAEVWKFGHLMWRADSLDKTLTLGKIEGRRRRGWRRMRWLDGIINSIDMSFTKLREIVKDREVWRAAVCGCLTKSQTGLSDWTTTIIAKLYKPSKFSFNARLFFLRQDFFELPVNLTSLAPSK